MFGIAARMGRVGVATGNAALKPLKVAARAPLVRDGAERLASTGRDVGTDVVKRLEDVAGDVLDAPALERTIDRALAGPLPEAIARSMVEQHVVGRIVDEMLASADVEAALDDARLEELVERVVASPGFERAVKKALETVLTADLTATVVDSPAFHRTLESVLSSPEVRAALSAQTAGFAGELAARARQSAARVDASVERRPRRLFRRPARVAGEYVAYAGAASRGVALVVDALLAQLIFVVGGALVGLVASLFGHLRPQWLVGTLVGGGWLLVVAVYFVTFWATVGQTPGMRLMGLRVRDARGQPPSAGRALLRLFGLALAIIPLFAGCLPMLVDSRRRALQDFLARTTVAYDHEAPDAPPVHA
jgi:uncharacterized RDD family membrane protein YckC